MSVVKARHEGKVLKPFQDLDLKDGEEVRIRVRRKRHQENSRDREVLGRA